MSRRDHYGHIVTLAGMKKAVNTDEWKRIDIIVMHGVEPQSSEMFERVVCVVS